MNDLATLDTATISEMKELMGNNFNEMVKFYLEDADSYLGAVQKGCAENNVEEIVRPAHTLKSASRQMGAMKLGELSEKMERSAKEAIEKGDGAESLQAILPLLTEELGAVKSAITTFIEQ